MKMMNCVEVAIEKETYVQDGVHLGMQGWICLEQRTEGYWLVNFPQCGEEDDIAEISIKEEHLKLIPKMDAAINERIRAQFEASEKKEKAMPSVNSANKTEDFSDYLI